MGEADASTLGCLARHAAARPDRAALILDGRRIGFGTFHTALRKVVGFVAGLGLRDRAVAAVDFDDPFEHWLLLLACEALGIATASIDGRARTAYGSLLTLADILVTSAPKPVPGCRRVARVAAGWLQRLPDRPGPVACGNPDAHRTLRLLQTSGTTGPVKWMRATQRSQEFWLAQYRRRSAIAAETRHLVVTGFHLNAAYLYATACLRAGGCCIVETRTDLAAVAVGLRPNHAALLPGELAALAAGVAHAGAVVPMSIATLGGRIGPALRRQAEAVFGRPVTESYGSNETGPIATMDGAGDGALLPGVEIAIVDTAGRALADGQPGLLRVRSAGVVEGYIDAPAATAAAFHDGWFQPGDLAVALGAGRIRLLGRADDMLNIGGLKVSPLAFEEAARRLPVLRDVCVVGLPAASGGEALAVAVVLAPGAEPAEAVRQLAALLPRRWGPATLHAVPAIPRTDTGKLARAALRTLLLDRRGLAPPADS